MPKVFQVHFFKGFCVKAVIAPVLISYLFSCTAWAWVGHGHSQNLNSPSYEARLKTSPKIIVSRSHAGEVETVAKKTFGGDVKVISAGGAGKIRLLFAFQLNW